METITVSEVSINKILAKHRQQKGNRFPEGPATPVRIELSRMYTCGKITLNDYRLACAIVDGNRELVDLLIRRLAYDTK